MVLEATVRDIGMGPLAGVAGSSARDAAQASKAKASEATSRDGHSLGAEVAAHGS